VILRVCLHTCHNPISMSSHKRQCYDATTEALNALRLTPNDPAAWDTFRRVLSAHLSDDTALLRVYACRGLVPPEKRTRQLKSPDVFCAEDVPPPLESFDGRLDDSLSAVEYVIYGVLQGPVTFTSLRSESLGAFLDFPDGRPRLHLGERWTPKDLLAACTRRELSRLLPYLCVIRFMWRDCGIDDVPVRRFRTIHRLSALLDYPACTPAHFRHHVANAILQGACSIRDRRLDNGCTLAELTSDHSRGALFLPHRAVLSQLGVLPEEFGYWNVYPVQSPALAWALLAGLNVGRDLVLHFGPPSGNLLMGYHPLVPAWPLPIGAAECARPVRVAWAAC
jgi:hypothetical protein